MDEPRSSATPNQSYTDAIEGDAERTHADVSEAYDLMDYEPTVDVLDRR